MRARSRRRCRRPSARAPRSSARACASARASPAPPFFSRLSPSCAQRLTLPWHVQRHGCGEHHRQRAVIASTFPTLHFPPPSHPRPHPSPILTRLAVLCNAPSVAFPGTASRPARSSRRLCSLACACASARTSSRSCQVRAAVGPCRLTASCHACAKAFALEPRRTDSPRTLPANAALAPSSCPRRRVRGSTCALSLPLSLSPYSAILTDHASPRLAQEPHLAAVSNGRPPRASRRWARRHGRLRHSDRHDESVSVSFAPRSTLADTPARADPAQAELNDSIRRLVERFDEEARRWHGIVPGADRPSVGQIQTSKSTSCACLVLALATKTDGGAPTQKTTAPSRCGMRASSSLASYTATSSLSSVCRSGTSLASASRSNSAAVRRFLCTVQGKPDPEAHSAEPHVWTYACVEHFDKPPHGSAWALSDGSNTDPSEGQVVVFEPAKRGPFPFSCRIQDSRDN